MSLISPISAVQPHSLTCTLVEGFLSAVECEALIARLEAAGIGATAALYPPSYRNNDRLVLDDEALAAALYPRIAAHAPAVLCDAGEAEGVVWRRQRLNPRFRCCRYRDGQRFTIHRDGVYHAGPRARSRLTFMIYLNDASEFAGGATRYYSDRSGRELLRAIAPQRGACVVFDHALWHDGEAVCRGTKYVLRSDVIYERDWPGVEQPASSAPAVQHDGYIWAAALLPDGTIASGGRDQTIRISGPALQQLQVLHGHQSSVGCLAAAGELLWSGDRHGMLRRWRNVTGTWQADGARPAHTGATLGLLPLAGAPRGICMASAGADGTIRLYADSLAEVAALREHTGWVWTLAATADALWSGGEDGTVRRHDLHAHAATRVVSLKAAVHALVHHADLLYAGLADGRIVLLDAQTLVPRAERAAHAGAVRALAIGPAGWIASGGEDDTVALWSADLSTPLACHLHDDFVRTLVVLPGGALLSGSYDGTLRKWSAPLPS